MHKYPKSLSLTNLASRGRVLRLLLSSDLTAAHTTRGCRRRRTMVAYGPFSCTYLVTARSMASEPYASTLRSDPTPLCSIRVRMRLKVSTTGPMALRIRSIALSSRTPRVLRLTLVFMIPERMERLWSVIVRLHLIPLSKRPNWATTTLRKQPSGATAIDFEAG